MHDLLAERSAEDEALCAVCGGGDSDKATGNEIVFCERCDVAVHQKCYAVDNIPAGKMHVLIFKNSIPSQLELYPEVCLPEVHSYRWSFHFLL